MLGLTAVQMAVILGKMNSACIAKWAAFSLTCLAVAAATGGAGAALVGAYAPVMMAFC